MLFRSGITYSAQCDFAVHIKKPPKKRVAYHKSGRLRRKSKEIVPSGNKFDNTYVVYWWKVLESRALTAGVQYLYRRWWLIMIDRKSTRLNSSHVASSYAVFCLKKKKIK